jgi:hypothetical protein
VERDNTEFAQMKTGREKEEVILELKGEMEKKEGCFL